MIWFKKSIYFLLAILLLASCRESKSKGPNSTGRASEIIVVCNKPLWNGAIGDTIRASLMKDMPGLPEAEPEYTLINVSEKDFSTFLQTHRNVLVVDINPANKKSNVETLRNLWSHPQRVIKMKAGSDTAFFNLYAKFSETIKDLFDQNERVRFRELNSLNQNYAVEKILAQDFGIKMIISKDFYLAKKTSDFVWLRSEATTMSLGLMIYTYPYKDTAQMAPAAIMATRDRYTKIYVPGPLDSTYMTTEREFYTPISRKILFKNLFAIETRGLWKIHGDFMGGPFINYSIVDAPRKRIVVFDGYVYYPNKSKRNYVRQMESIIWGTQFEKPEITQKPNEKK